ncbi:hypothetical protein I3760_10G165400 [Carya illinoinensis]|nr:hypothetical protein I3760_10G165400 [Carya illinoinensis]
MLTSIIIIIILMEKIILKRVVVSESLPMPISYSVVILEDGCWQFVTQSWVALDVRMMMSTGQSSTYYRRS